MKAVESSQAETRTLKMTARDWRIMAALMAGISLSSFNVMFTSVALPTMRTYFALDVEQATWIATAYFIPAVALMPLQTRIGQHWGMRRVYISGLLILSAGAMMTALASNFPWLLTGRVLQGIGWSALYPLALILIRAHFPAHRHGEMMGLWESSVGVATIISPVIAGQLVHFFGWRAVYVVLGMVAGLGVLLSRGSLPPAEAAKQQERTGSNWPGVIGLTLALALTLLAIARLNVILFVFGGFVWLVWLVTARRADTPYIPPSIFANRRFVSASLAANVRLLVAIGALIALPLFFEDVQGLSPSLVGSLVVIYSIFLFLGSWPGGRWSDRAGPAVPGAVGYVAMIAGILLLLGLDYRLSVGIVALALSVRGLGAGLSQAPFAKAATDAVPVYQARIAAGLYGTIRYSGLALGTALVGILLQARLTHYDALGGGPAALPAYRELWLILAMFGVVGLGLTWIMARSRPIETAVEDDI